MSRDSEKIHELEEWKKKREIEIAIQDGISKRVRSVCITATGALVSIFYAMGDFLYTNWDALSEAVKAFLLARGGK